MKRINLLDANTCNKIAAGEVVERPFSVVKELIENSIDAGAKNITVEIFEGGQKNIKITDDGHGIHPDDIEKAFLSHATSKISDVEDIYKISSLGFRGEALASIAAVSTVKLISRSSDFETGKEICINGGVINNISEIGCNIGTIIEVSDIFFNVPARQKFLKSPQREAALINDIVERLAIANSSISFKLFNNGKQILSTYATKDLKDTLRNIYGKTVSNNVISFENHNDIATIYGYIGNAEISRGSRNNQSIFVNKRYIKNKLITTAVENAFKSFLTINKFPFFVLFLEIFPDFIDVNVHPTKSEIKFKDDRVIFKLVFDAVHEAIKNGFKVSFEEENNLFIDNTIAQIESVQIPIDLKSNEYISDPQTSYYNNSVKNNNDSQFSYNNTVKDNNYQLPDENKTLQNDVNTTSANVNISELPSKNINEQVKNIEITPLKEAKFSPLSVIGQFNNTYILAEGLEGLYIIDQHAAHEKIFFEKYSEEIKKGTVITQILITPVILELSREDFGYYNENLYLFNRIGFNIEIFGENTISIREHPIIVGSNNIRTLFMDILDNIKNLGTGTAIEFMYDKIARLACKSAIKAKDALSYIEMKALVEELRFINEPFTCPHGRPTIIKITINELEKKFKRIQ